MNGRTLNSWLVGMIGCVASVALVAAAPAHAQACGSDINGDGSVDGGDLSILLVNWGACPVSAPTISQVTPNSGPAGGGTVFYIGGTNLNRATSVTVGGVAATILAAHPTVIVATTPANIIPGAKTVAVTTPSGTALARNAFIYASSAPSWSTLIEVAPDPAVVTNAALRDAITATGLPWRVRDNATQIEMVLIPPGTFNMGCSASSEYGCGGDENPVHAVTLTNAFYIGRYEVTQAQWTARMGSNPSQHYWASKAVPAAQVPNRPVEMVSWDDVQPFLWVAGLRLPTEAEWEYAYRAGTTTAFHSMPGFPSGTNDANLKGYIAWWYENAENQTRPVGGKAPNGFGLYDMSGNVSEWVNDLWSDAYYASSPSTNPPGPAKGYYRVFRGGSFDSSVDELRSSSRELNPASNVWIDRGFRVARTP